VTFASQGMALGNRGGTSAPKGDAESYDDH
jgi:hypothetical protein